MSTTTLPRLPAQVPVARLHPILMREVLVRAQKTPTEANPYGGGFEVVCQELAAWSGRPKDTYAKRLQMILSRHQDSVDFATADELITGLGLTDQVWHGELADLYGADSTEVVPEGFCVVCETWTLGTSCAWCGTRTVTAERMLERKRSGHCQITGRAARGIVRGHRVCKRYEGMVAKLGPTVERRLGLEQPKTVRQGRRPSPVSDRITPAQLAFLHRVYQEEHLGTPAIAEIVWQQLGFDDLRSAENAIRHGFTRAGYKLRSREQSHQRTLRGRRRVGFGRRVAIKGRGAVLAAAVVDELWQEYQAGESMKMLAERRYRELGFADWQSMRNVVEYAWRVHDRKLRTAAEAQKLALARGERRRCQGTTSLLNQRHRQPGPCTQFPLDDSDFCRAHDPRYADEVRKKAAAMRNSKKRRGLDASVPWDDVLRHLEPLLVPRLDPFLQRPLEKAGGALARHTGVPAGTCSRLLLGQKEYITVKLADRLLAPVGMTAAEITREEEAWPQAA